MAIKALHLEIDTKIVDRVDEYRWKHRIESRTATIEQLILSGLEQPPKLARLAPSRERELRLEVLAHDAGLREAAQRCVAIVDAIKPGTPFTLDTIILTIRREFGLEFNNDREWIRQKAEAEDGCSVSVGGFATAPRECPFCGGAADLIDAPESGNEGAVVVECQKCRASGPVVFGVKEDPRPHAIELWNRRAKISVSGQANLSSAAPFKPNASNPVLSGGAGSWVALHRFTDGQLWVLRKHPYSGGWVTLRIATLEDEATMLKAGATPISEPYTAAPRPTYPDGRTDSEDPE